MLLIADSGSTKTSWRLISKSASPVDFATEGYNPHYKSADEIQLGLEKDLIPQLSSNAQEINEVYFYGAGISTPRDENTVFEALKSVFEKSQLHVHHDLLAAARALCQHSKGIACILGTGSNSCLYDGKDISDNIPALGFTLGDEGGGSGIGREILKAFFYRELPADLNQAFIDEYQLTKSELFKHIYGGPNPNRYVAGYSKFTYTHRNHPFISNLLKQCFSEFIQRKVKPYKDSDSIPIGFIGSVAWHFSDIIKQCLEEEGLEAGAFIRNPLERLSDYHQNA